MIPGSSFTIELAANGQGVDFSGGYAGDDLYIHAKQLVGKFFWERCE